VPLIAPSLERFTVSLARLVARPLEPGDFLVLLAPKCLQLPFDRIALGLELGGRRGMTPARFPERRVSCIDLIAFWRGFGSASLARPRFLLPLASIRTRLSPRPRLAGTERLQLCRQAPARELDHFPGPFERRGHQLWVGDLLGHAAREQ